MKCECGHMEGDHRPMCYGGEVLVEGGFQQCGCHRFTGKNMSEIEQTKVEILKMMRDAGNIDHVYRLARAYGVLRGTEGAQAILEADLEQMRLGNPFGRREFEDE